MYRPFLRDGSASLIQQGQGGKSSVRKWTSLFSDWEHHPGMNSRIDKRSNNATLVRVQEEMAAPRMAKSVRDASASFIAASGLARNSRKKKTTRSASKLSVVTHY